MSGHSFQRRCCTARCPLAYIKQDEDWSDVLNVRLETGPP